MKNLILGMFFLALTFSCPAMAETYLEAKSKISQEVEKMAAECINKNQNLNPEIKFPDLDKTRTLYFIKYLAYENGIRRCLNSHLWGITSKISQKQLDHLINQLYLLQVFITTHNLNYSGNQEEFLLGNQNPAATMTVIIKQLIKNILTYQNNISFMGDDEYYLNSNYAKKQEISNLAKSLFEPKDYQDFSKQFEANSQTLENFYNQIYKDFSNYYLISLNDYYSQIIQSLQNVKTAVQK